MTHDQDERLGRLLRKDAPPERDPLFRVGVLERRERQRFQRRSLVLIVTALALAAIFAAGLNAGASLFATAGIVVLCVGLVLAYVFSVPGVLELLRRFRNDGGTAGKN